MNPGRRTVLPGLVACLAFALLALLLPSGADAAKPDLSTAVQMSNERTFSRWAPSIDKAPIRKGPGPNSKPITSLRYWTEHGSSEIYLILRRFKDVRNVTWMEVRIPMRPNGRTGWVRATALGRPRPVKTHLVVNRAQLSATLYRAGRQVWTSPIGIGKPEAPTPAGRFMIRERFAVANPAGAYGPWAFGTSGYSVLSDWPVGGVVGIHGTNQPSLIPGRISHGCIRVPNPAIRKLAGLMERGTPVWIR